MRLLICTGPILLLFTLTGALLRLLEEAVKSIGYGGEIDWGVVLSLPLLFDVTFWLGLGVMGAGGCLLYIQAKCRLSLQW